MSWCDNPPGSSKNWYLCDSKKPSVVEEPIPFDIVTTTPKPQKQSAFRYIYRALTTSTTQKPLDTVRETLSTFTQTEESVEEELLKSAPMPNTNMSWTPSLKCFQIPTLPSPDKWDDAFKTRVQVVILISLFVFLVGKNPSHALIVGVLSMCIKSVNLLWVLFIGAAYQAYHTKSWLMFIAMLFVILSLCGQG